jgi:predicted  nucleic acid-binding Zn-ribbon protein
MDCVRCGDTFERGRSKSLLCPDCRKREARIRASHNRKAREDAMRSLGLVKCRGSLGGTYWE